MKKFISTVIAALMTVSAAVPAFAADTAKTPFTDVDASSEQGQAIVKMYNKGYLAGYEDGTFRPDGYVTRAELVRIINQVFDFKVNDKIVTADFSDNATTEAWYYEDVKIAQQMGYISGFGDNSFRPKDNFTRQQACVVLDLITNASDTEAEVTITDTVSPWALKYVSSAVENGLFKLEEGNTFRATQNITRGELCVALAGFVKEDTTVATTETTTNSTESSTETTTASATTTTKKSTSSSGGGSGSSSSSSSKTTTTTTEATTETTTASKSETTTKKQTTTTTTTTTEATTEITTAAVVLDSDLKLSLDRTIRNMTKYVIPNSTSDAVKEVATDVVNAMQSYVADPSYDVQSAANEAMDKYHNLSADEKKEFKNNVLKYCGMSDLLNLSDAFFPGLVS
jgi:uncharacterized FlaG/YvyC family protein